MSLEQFNKYSPILAVLVSFILDLAFTMTPYWPLTLIAAIVGGVFCVEMKWGALAGMIGVILAWLVNLWFSINDIALQADQLGKLIIGSSGAGGIIIIVIFLVGALLGFLGGSIGSGLRMLVVTYTNNVVKE